MVEGSLVSVYSGGGGDEGDPAAKSSWCSLLHPLLLSLDFHLGLSPVALNKAPTLWLAVLPLSRFLPFSDVSRSSGTMEGEGDSG